MVLEPSNVIRYFAELAPVGRGPRWNHAPAPADLVTIPWPWEVQPEGDGSLIIEAKHAPLERLWNAARINGSRDFLRLGWLFLAGVAEINGKQTKLFVPIASAPVRLRRPPRSAPKQYYQLVADSDMSVPDSLFPDHEVRRRMNEQLDDLVAEAFPAGSSVITWPLVRPLVEAFCEAHGISEDVVVEPPGSAIGPTDSSLSLHHGIAVYTARDRTAINLASTLRPWARERLAETAFGRLYGPAAEVSRPDLTHHVANSLPLNRSQEQAILTARQEPITVLSGPPGTGKTHTAVALAIDQVAHGNSVLIAAQSDDAVDAIEAVLTRHASPRHVRFGSRSSRKRVAEDLSEGLVADQSIDARQTEAKLVALQEELERIESGLRRRLEIEEEFTRALDVRLANSWCFADAPGLAGEVVSPERIADLIRLLKRRNAGGIFGRLRRDRAKRIAATRLAVSPVALEAMAEAITDILEAELAVRAGQAVASQSISDSFERFEAAAGAVRSQFGVHLEAMRSGRSWARGASRAVGLLATALRSGRAAQRAALQKVDISDALAALPLWLGTLADIDDVLPVRPAMFDIVIIDEASQVNQVRAATTLARGRRAAIVGDPRQLRHVSFVGDEMMKSAAAAAGLGTVGPLLDVRRNSLFDVAASNVPVVQLTEHYRSAPHLISFSSRQFYEDRLRLMTEHPDVSQRDVIDVVRVPGTRGDDSVIDAEVAGVMGLVERALERGLDSVGILSPFRAQADALEASVLRQFTPEQLDQLDLRVGTVHGFQGNERDHIYVSLGIDPSDLRSLRFAQDPNLFNVMITRARVSLTMVLSVDLDDLPEGLLVAYLRHAAVAPGGPVSQRDEQRGWTREVIEALRPYGLAMWENYPVGGYLVDIVVGDGRQALGVECRIHDEGVAAHIERHVALRRAGWEVMAAMESRYLARPEEAAEAIARRVIGRGRPGSPQSRPIDRSGQ